MRPHCFAAAASRLMLVHACARNCLAAAASRLLPDFAVCPCMRPQLPRACCLAFAACPCMLPHARTHTSLHTCAPHLCATAHCCLSQGHMLHPSGTVPLCHKNMPPNMLCVCLAPPHQAMVHAGATPPGHGPYPQNRGVTVGLYPTIES
ncbi:hypothetical protein ACOSP7_013523 [Xanthoceras sorbifolium]